MGKSQSVGESSSRRRSETIVKFDHPVETISSGGRPVRQRMRVLDHWRNEDVEYERKQGSKLPTVSAVRMPQPSSMLSSPQSAQKSHCRVRWSPPRSTGQDEAGASPLQVLKSGGVQPFPKYRKNASPGPKRFSQSQNVAQLPKKKERRSMH